jgi:hypothetical protein
MVITVETPEGLKVGRAVRALRHWRTPEWMGGQGTLITGEAVVVDLGSRGRLFALLSGPGLNGPWSAQNVFRDSLPVRSEINNDGVLARAWRNGEDVRADVKCPTDVVYSLMESRHSAAKYRNCPPMIKFGDLRDPASAKIVDPTDFARTFGPGVQLKSVRIALTHEQVTHQVEQLLPWVGSFPKDDSFMRNDPLLQESPLKHLVVMNLILKEV